MTTSPASPDGKAAAGAVHVAVVGGGVFGGCTAYELLKAGCRATLVERDPIGRHASSRNPGNLNPILATPSPLRPLAMYSYRRHETLRRELEELGCQDYGVEAVRRVLIGFEESDRPQLDAIAGQFHAEEGFSTCWLDRRDLDVLDARLSPEAAFGLLIEGNRSLDAAKFTAAVLEGAAKLGATLRSETVSNIESLKRGKWAVHTDKGRIECDAVVLACGPWTDGIKAWFGVDLGIVPVKGELLRLRLAGTALTHDFTHGLISLYRRRGGEVWIGVTEARCGLDEQPSETARRTLLDGAKRIMPAVAEAEVIGHLAAVRPVGHSGLPVIGRLPGQENIFVANGGGGKGMLICTGAGRAIADLIAGGQTAVPVSGFTP